MSPVSSATAQTLHAVLARFALGDAAIRDIRTGRVNKHWRVEAGSETYALRRYTPQRSVSAINYEHDILRHVEARGWPVAPPLLSRESQTLVDVSGRSYSLFPFLPGRPSPETPHYSHLKGGLLARLHQDLASWESSGQREGFGRAWELDVYVAANCEFGSLNELLFAFGQQHADLARAIRSQKYAMLRELSTLGYGELPAVPGHFDFHHDNLLFQRGELTGLLDLDLTHLDARVADIAQSISLDCLAPPAYNEIDPAAAGAFVDGYTEHTTLSDEELQLIVPLVRASILWLVSWRLAHWAEGTHVDDALRSIQRSVSARFPSLGRQRDELEAAVLQAGSR